LANQQSVEQSSSEGHLLPATNDTSGLVILNDSPICDEAADETVDQVVDDAVDKAVDETVVEAVDDAGSIAVTPEHLQVGEE